MMIELPVLPYEMNALEPYISEKTLSFHYGKHHKAYVQKTNDLINGTEFADKSLKELILISASDTVLTPLFNNAAQSFNHDFYWKSLTPTKQEISFELKQALIKDFGSVEDFKKVFADAAAGQFGSGWAWLVADNKDNLKIITTSNAGTPLTHASLRPLLCLDVWEHAYYLDYQNKRADYLKALIDNSLNWEFALKNFKQKGN
jgi:Fe-Mn family superoxide dismutase